LKTRLGNISSIQTGVFAKPIREGEVVYLQSKHIDGEGGFVKELYADLKKDGRIEKHLLQKGDVLFAAKGTRNFAACYADDKIAAVASTSFFVIRLQDNSVLPEYLAWYLNHPRIQRKLKGCAKGTSIVSISKAVLVKLEITIPTVAKQRMILDIYNLRKLEKKTKKKIEELREKEIQQILINETI